jgi:hypothetical protein
MWIDTAASGYDLVMAPAVELHGKALCSFRNVAVVRKNISNLLWACTTKRCLQNYGRGEKLKLHFPHYKQLTAK